MKYKCTRNSPGHLTIARRHPERSEGSPAENTRSLAVLGMTWWGVTCTLVYLIGLLAFSGGLLANSVSQKQLDYLSQQKQDWIIKIHEDDRALALPTTIPETREQIHLLEKKLATFQAMMVALHHQLNHQHYEQTLLTTQLKTLQKSYIHSAPSRQIDAMMAFLQNEIQLNHKAITLLMSNLALARQEEALLKKNHYLLRHHVVQLKRLASSVAFKTQEAQLRSELEALYAAAPSPQPAATLVFSPETRAMASEKARVLNSMMINVIHMRLRALLWTQQWQDALFAFQQDPSLDHTERVKAYYQQGIALLSTQQTQLKQQQTLLDHSLDVSKASHELQALRAQLHATTTQLNGLTKDYQKVEEQLSQQASAYIHLPDLSVAHWPQISKELTQTPIQIYQYFKNLCLKVYDNYLWQDWQHRLLMWGCLLAIFLGGGGLFWGLKPYQIEPIPVRLIERIYKGTVWLLYKNIPYLMIIASTESLFYFNELPYAHYQLFFNLMGIIIGFVNLHFLARLILIEHLTDFLGNDRQLYRRIRRLLILGVTTSTLMVFSHQYPLSHFMQALFNRFFMLFLLVIAFALWHSREKIIHALAPLLKDKKRYVANAIFLLLILAPVTLFTTAFIGIMGYYYLAWNLSRYQVLFLMVIASYTLLRGLLVELLDMISEKMIASLYNGWLWIEVFLKPLDKLLRMGLFLGVLYVFARLIEHSSSFPLLAWSEFMFNYVIFSSSGILITVKSSLAFTAIVITFLWLAKWTREFSYRWLYRHTQDVGMRNSLSVFTQYLVIVIGFFFSFRMLGFDFTGLSLVLGGLAVGMGFGLRDFANNIIGGLMLLIERPVREGDLITLGDYEGRVAHIGIRAMRICSWDNMEVLIPNAETFNKPFTNWTHQDSIVRTVIPLKVNRTDDPALVQKIIYEVLALTPEIVATPAPQVFLTQIDEALISFEARYFINVNLHTRFEVRSQVLFAIMTRFKEAGIRAPVPPFKVELASV